MEILWLTSTYLYQILDTDSALIDNSTLLYVYGNVVDIAHNTICGCVAVLSATKVEQLVTVLYRAESSSPRISYASPWSYLFL